MAKKLIDIDLELLERAKEIIGAGTYKETVNAGLREIIATAARRRQIERLLDPEPSDLEDPAIMASTTSSPWAYGYRNADREAGLCSSSASG